MLYDKRRDVKAEPFALTSLVAWLEKQPDDEAYDYNCNGKCLLSQYFIAHGFKNVLMWTDCFYHGPEPVPNNGRPDNISGLTMLPPNFDEIMLIRLPHTNAERH